LGRGLFLLSPFFYSLKSFGVGLTTSCFYKILKILQKLQWLGTGVCFSVSKFGDQKVNSFLWTKLLNSRAEGGALNYNYYLTVGSPIKLIFAGF
jgi:hypothetical protein